MRTSRTGIAAIIAIGLMAGGATIATAQDDEAAAPEPFRSAYAWSHKPASGDPTTLPNGVDRLVGDAWQFRLVKTNDPRMDGPLTFWNTVDDYDGAEVQVGAARIETEDGAWQEVPQFTLNFDRPPGDTVHRAFIGEGAYEGLYAIAIDTRGEGNRNIVLKGFIIAADPPTAPVAMSTQ